MGHLLVSPDLGMFATLENRPKIGTARNGRGRKIRIGIMLLGVLTRRWQDGGYKTDKTKFIV